MDKETNNEKKRRLSPRMIVIIALALVVLSEGAFLLLRRKPSGADASGPDAAAVSAEPGSATGEEGSATTAAPDASGTPESSAKSEEKSGDKKSDSKDSGAEAPVQTPAVTIPPENQGKAYAGAIAVMANYAKNPSEATLAYLMGGDLLGEPMQRFLPALLTMGGQTMDVMKTEMDAALNLPEGTTALTITGEQALGADALSAAREQLRVMETSFAAIAESFSGCEAFTDDEWNAIGSELGLSAADAKRLLTEITASSKTMAGLLSGTDVTEGYAVAMKTNTGADMATNVYCVAGKWVTNAFFNIELS